MPPTVSDCATQEVTSTVVVRSTQKLFRRSRSSLATWRCGSGRCQVVQHDDRRPAEYCRCRRRPQRSCDSLMAGSFNLITHTLANQGISNTIVTVNDLAALEAAINLLPRPSTQRPSKTFNSRRNRNRRCCQLRAAGLKHRIPFIIDNTFGTPP